MITLLVKHYKLVLVYYYHTLINLFIVILLLGWHEYTHDELQQMEAKKAVFTVKQVQMI